jgi:hypothetical protein
MRCAANPPHHSRNKRRSKGRCTASQAKREHTSVTRRRERRDVLCGLREAVHRRRMGDHPLARDGQTQVSAARCMLHVACCMLHVFNLAQPRLGLASSLLLPRCKQGSCDCKAKAHMDPAATTATVAGRYGYVVPPLLLQVRTVFPVLDDERGGPTPHMRQHARTPPACTAHAAPHRRTSRPSESASASSCRLWSSRKCTNGRLSASLLPSRARTRVFWVLKGCPPD